ncbi:hypothetical protein PR048_030903 [Dryococelus australis]|uniref:Uncharacterized protein n=1 Tax=Dryococelus australis TaxID=614101 RepID=A0ABQ9GAN3_9NEOP|nr:hypothetical protein PR048_030903 [Dryococelus australis]
MERYCTCIVAAASLPCEMWAALCYNATPIYSCVRLTLLTQQSVFTQGNKRTIAKRRLLQVCAWDIGGQLPRINLHAKKQGALLIALRIKYRNGTPKIGSKYSFRQSNCIRRWATSRQLHASFILTEGWQGNDLAADTYTDGTGSPHEFTKRHHTPASRTLHCLILAVADFPSAGRFYRCSSSIALNSATHSLNSSAWRPVTLLYRPPRVTLGARGPPAYRSPAIRNTPLPCCRRYRITAVLHFHSLAPDAKQRARNDTTTWSVAEQTFNYFMSRNKKHFRAYVPRGILELHITMHRIRTSTSYDAKNYARKFSFLKNEKCNIKLYLRCNSDVAKDSLQKFLQLRNNTNADHVKIEPARLPPRLAGFDPRPGNSRISASGNRAGRCRWSAGFLGDLPFPPTMLRSHLTSPSSALKREPPTCSFLPRLRSRSARAIKGDTGTRIKCAIATKRRVLNWRAVLSSHCVTFSSDRIILSVGNKPVLDVLSDGVCHVCTRQSPYVMPVLLYSRTGPLTGTTPMQCLSDDVTFHGNFHPRCPLEVPPHHDVTSYLPGRHSSASLPRRWIPQASQGGAGTNGTAPRKLADERHRRGLQTGSPWWEASSLTARPQAREKRVCGYSHVEQGPPGAMHSARRNILKVELSRASGKLEVNKDGLYIVFINLPLITHWDRGGVVVRPLASRIRFTARSIPDDVAGRRVFSGISHFPRPCIPAPLHTHLASTSSALKTPIGRDYKTINVLRIHCTMCELKREGGSKKKILFLPAEVLFAVSANAFRARIYPDYEQHYETLCNIGYRPHSFCLLTSPSLRSLAAAAVCSQFDLRPGGKGFCACFSCRSVISSEFTCQCLISCDPTIKPARSIYLISSLWLGRTLLPPPLVLVEGRRLETSTQTTGVTATLVIRESPSKAHAESNSSSAVHSSSGPRRIAAVHQGNYRSRLNTASPLKHELLLSTRLACHRTPSAIKDELRAHTDAAWAEMAHVDLRSLFLTMLILVTAITAAMCWCHSILSPVYDGYSLTNLPAIPSAISGVATLLLETGPPDITFEMTSTSLTAAHEQSCTCFALRSNYHTSI